MEIPWYLINSLAYVLFSDNMVHVQKHQKSKKMYVPFRLHECRGKITTHDQKYGLLNDYSFSRLLWFNVQIKLDLFSHIDSIDWIAFFPHFMSLLTGLLWVFPTCSERYGDAWLDFKLTCVTGQTTKKYVLKEMTCTWHQLLCQYFTILEYYIFVLPSLKQQKIKYISACKGSNMRTKIFLASMQFRDAKHVQPASFL